MQLSTIENEVLRNIVYANSPWLKDVGHLPKAEKFRREAFFRVQKQLHAQHRMAVLIKGPRRVGKTEIQKQLILELINEKRITPGRVLYLSLDDVQIQAENPKDRWRMVSGLLDEWARMLGFNTYDEINVPAYCFLDEVQAVENWATLVKNRVDRNPHVRIVLSGSAAHSIFQKSLQTLLGRVISEELTTFSFREFMQFKQSAALPNIGTLHHIQQEFERTFSARKLHDALFKFAQNIDLSAIRNSLNDFLHQGGFPQLWRLAETNLVEKAHVIDENYVRKVTLEDLMLLRKIRKPELFERLLRHLFARPGQEYNQQKVASDLGTTSVTLGEAMDLLRQTDLFLFVEKFSFRAEPLKYKNVKIYPIDLMLAFAMTKVAPTLVDIIHKGTVAESLVAQTIFRLRGLSNIAFLQKTSAIESGEIDFYLRADVRDCPIEVKFQPQIKTDDLKFMRKIMVERNLESGLLITPDNWEQSGNIFSVPLWAFMLIA